MPPAIFRLTAMRVHFAVLPLIATIATIATLVAQPSRPDAALAAAGIAAREDALDNLLSERESPAAFDSAIGAARKAGVTEQAILEARFLYHVDRREDQKIAALLPEFLKQCEVFKIEDSAIFGVKEDWLAVVEYVQAIASLETGDKDGFKQHITEAFWLGPRQAAAFAPHIERLRLKEAMSKVRVDFTATLAPLDGGGPVALEKLIVGKKALLIHFWSPLSRECEASLPDFARSAEMLSANGFAVVSLLPPGNPDSVEQARRLILPYAAKSCGAWLIDSVEKPLSRDLRIQSIPNMVIVSPEGGVLYNGDPTDEMFWDALRKLDAGITRPESAIEE